MTLTDDAPRPHASGDVRRLGPTLIVGAFGLAVMVVVGLALRGTAGAGYDLAAYLAAAGRVAAGATPYQAQTLAGPFDPGPAGLYLYAPPLAVLLSPVASLLPDVAAVAWLIVRVALLGLAIALLPVRPWVRGASLLVAAFSFPVLLDLNLGNVSLVVLALMALAWRFLDRPAGSAFVALALAVRPPLAVVPAWQALRRRWRPFAWTIAAGLVVVALTLPVVGLQGYRDYLTVVRDMVGFQGIRSNVDLASIVAGAGLPDPWPTIAYLAGLLTGAVIIVAATRLDRDAGFVATVGASLLLVPLLWPHYLVFLLLPAALLADRGRRVGLLMPLLGWLPGPFLPFVAIFGALAPFLVARRT
ncbi:MAG: glycosyltransferase family 87 protein [Candidatus Limnocylindrales bacterium]